MHSITGTPPAARQARTLDPTALAVIELLCERFPKLFVRYEARRKPLKIGIHLDLLAVLDGAVTPAELSSALHIYCANKVYRSRLQAGAWRYDLDSQHAGEVAPEHARANTASGRTNVRPAQRTGRDHNSGGEFSPRGPHGPPAKRTGCDTPPPHAPPHAPTRQRASLDELRMAARQRKAGAS